MIVDMIAAQRGANLRVELTVRPCSDRHAKESAMRTPARIGRHPIHPMLVPLPIGLWIFAFLCDLLFVLGAGASHWFTISFYAMIAGIGGALLAAIPGTIDMFSLSGVRKKLALTHMALNLTVVALFAINLWLRINGAEVAGLPLALTIVAITLLSVSGWLGGHLVYVHAVGVDVNQVAVNAKEGNRGFPP